MQGIEKKIIFRVDASPEMGLGHFYRSFSLAQYLKEIYLIVFIVKNPNKRVVQIIANESFGLEIINGHNDNLESKLLNEYHKEHNIIVIDGYHFTANYIENVKKIGYKVVSIDGIYNIHFYSDVIINYNFYASRENYSIEGYTKLYLGKDYLLLRQPFLTCLQNNYNREENNCLITFGGSDKFDFTTKVAKIIVNIKRIDKIYILHGALANVSEDLKLLLRSHPEKIVLKTNLSAKELIVLYENVKLAVCPGSSSLYELFVMKIPVVTGYYVENQKLNSRFVSENELGVSIGDFLLANTSIIEDAIDNIFNQYNYYSKNIKLMLPVDPKGNIQRIFKEL